MQRDLVEGTFKPVPGSPSIKPTPDEHVGRKTMIWDGENLYQWEGVKDWGIRIHFAFKGETPSGPQWFWRPPVELKGSFQVLATDSMTALVAEHGTGDEKDGLQFRIHHVNLVDGEKRTLFTKKDPDRLLFAEATVKDHDFIVFLNNGTIFNLPMGASQLRTVREGFWSDLSDRYIQTIKRKTTNEEIPQPPHFVGSPFFGKSGEIYVPMTVRETNVWSEEGIQRMFDSMTKEQQSKLIANGTWPLKDGEARKGSDEVFVLLSYNPDEKKLSKVPETRLGKMVKQNPDNGQWKLAQVWWPVMAEGPDGNFMSVTELIGSTSAKSQASPPGKPFPPPSKTTPTEKEASKPPR